MLHVGQAYREELMKPRMWTSRQEKLLFTDRADRLSVSWARRGPRYSLLRKSARGLRRVAMVVLFGSCIAVAQITIRNPNHLPLPETRPGILFRAACQVVAEEFHLHDSSKLEFPLILVLGEPWHYTADEDNQVYTIYLDHWDDTLFASSAMALASHRVVPRDRYKRMVVEILRRASEISPVDAHEIRRRR